MELPYKPIKETLKGKDNNEYCATGWLLSKLFDIELGCYITPETAIREKLGKEISLQLSQTLANIYSINDSNYPKTAFIAMSLIIPIFRYTFVTSLGVDPNRFDSVMKEMKAIVEEWNAQGFVDGCELVPETCGVS